MRPASYYRDKYQYHFFKKETFSILAKAAYILFYSTCLVSLFSFYLIYYPTKIKYTPQIQEYNETKIFIQPKNDSENCNLFKGRWLPDATDPLYTNYSCKELPSWKNCFLHGRKDTDFLHLRWKPDQCELPRFRPEAFLGNVRGKTMAFVGDSIARNQMESLLCLLSTVEMPSSLYKDDGDKSATWEFPKHNFTLMVLWSQFLVTANKRLINGSTSGHFDLHLDKVDIKWSKKIPSIDYLVFSGAHWFTRENYLFEGGNLIGCIYCQVPNVTGLGPGLAIRKAFQVALKEINNCKNCKKIFTLLRTYSPSHFEGGTWNNGGGCNRTKPYEKEEVKREGPDWDYRRIQVEEIENARNAGEESENIFEVLDITEMMWMRADGHPGAYWGNKWMKGYNDCLHWCLPGPLIHGTNFCSRLSIDKKRDYHLLVSRVNCKNTPCVIFHWQIFLLA